MASVTKTRSGAWKAIIRKAEIGAIKDSHVYRHRLPAYKQTILHGYMFI